MVDDFRLERVIGRGSRGVVYEATQLSLDRRVALRLLPPDPELDARFAHLEWPDHRNAVSMFAAGAFRGGHFVAMQLVRGPTLAQLREEGHLEPARALEILGNVATVLDATHRAGIVHGAVGARNVFVDREGHALLSDFGLGTGETDPAADRRAFAALVRECVGSDPQHAEVPASAAEVVREAASALPPGSLRGPRVARRRRWLAAAAAGCLAAIAALVAVVAGSGDELQGAPPILSGAQAIGSPLAGSAVSSVDCSGRPPGGGSLPCTVAQTQLGNRSLVAPRDGVIRRWTVRGARGELALQVLRRRGRRFDSIARSTNESVPDEGVHAFPANLPIRTGDLVALEVAPGTAVGVRRDAPGAVTARWFGPLNISVRPVERGPRSGFDHELLLRVEYLPGAEWEVPGRLTGAAAATAPAGRELTRLELSRGGRRRVTVVNVGGRVAIDLFTGSRRLARVPVEGADPRGGPPVLSEHRRPVVRLRWSNPDGQAIRHEYGLTGGTLTPRS